MVTSAAPKAVSGPAFLRRHCGLHLPAAVRERAERLGREHGAMPAYVYDLDGSPRT